MKQNTLSGIGNNNNMFGDDFEIDVELEIDI
jgi:hypothetical protein